MTARRGRRQLNSAVRPRRRGRDMADPQYVVIEVTLLESGGPVGTVGEPRMFCRYSAAHLPGTHLDDGEVSVVVRDSATQSWREYVRQTTLDDARGVIAQLEALGIPGRTPEAEGVVDTSDGWTSLSLRVKAEKMRRRSTSACSPAASTGQMPSGCGPYSAICSRWQGSRGIARLCTGRAEPNAASDTGRTSASGSS
jgi:hypothetical protein